MKYKFHILSLAISLALSVSVMAQTGYESETDLKKQAEQFWEEKDFSGALPLYSQLLSLYPKDPDYNYKFGSCMLHVEEDKSASLRYLEYAASRPNVNPEALFYLGKGYHLNYRFIEAQEKYLNFKEKGNAKEVEKLKVDQHIKMCKSGLNLLSNITDLAVLDKRTLNQADFFRTYDVSSFGGKIITKPEDFELAADKKVDEPFIMYLDRNADRLYYSSYGDKGKTGKDIYYSKKLPDGTWAEPQSIGSTINTKYDEDYTFFNSTTNTLYFSSTGHNSMGGYDVFKSTYDPASDTWSKPVNLDYAVNTPDNDFLYITNASEKTAYFATTRSSISGEVTVYKVNVERIPVDFTIIKGEFLSDATKAAKITVEDSNSGEIVGIWNSNGNDGGYLMTLPNGGSFKFTVETEESPMAYFGIVELPKQNVPKPLKQEIALVVENGYEKLIIKNLFDEVLESDGTLLTADFLKNRANLQINAEETEEVILENTEELAAADSSTGSVVKEFSNDELVKMAYKDAEELENDAKESITQTELAYAIANQRNKLATEKSKQADVISIEAQEMENERDKLIALKNGNDLRLESTELAKEAVIAYNLANKLKEKSDNLTDQSEQAFEVALQLDNAINSKSQADIDDAYSKIQGILSTDRKDDILAKATEDYDEKKRISEKQIQKAIKLNEEVTVLDKEIASLIGRADITKNKDEKALLLADVAEMEEQLISLRAEEKEAMNSAKKLQAETDALEEEGELIAEVIKDIKFGDANELGRLSAEDKQRLAGDITTTESTIEISAATSIAEQEEIAELKESVTSEKYEMEEGNVVSESDEIEYMQETGEPLVSIEGETHDTEPDIKEEVDKISEEKEDPLVSMELEVAHLEESESAEDNVDEETGSNSENLSEYSFVKKSEIPEENYDSFFETKETELAAISGESEKASAQVELYRSWLDKTSESIAAKDALIETETDEITRQVYEMELEELEHHKGEQEQQLKEAEERLSETNELTESVDKSFIKEDDIPEENYEFFFEEKLADTELFDNAYKKEKAKADIYDNWVDQMSDDLSEKKKELETASKSEKKDIKSRISVLEKELEDKRLSKAMAEIQVNKILEDRPELTSAEPESAESESIEEGDISAEEPLISIAGEETVDSDIENTEPESSESELIEEDDISAEEPLISIAGEETIDSDTENTESESAESESIEEGDISAEEPLISIAGEETIDSDTENTESESAESESIEEGDISAEEPLISIAGEETVDSDTENTEPESTESELIEEGGSSAEEPLISITVEETIDSDIENTEPESTESELIEEGGSSAEEPLIYITGEETVDSDTENIESESTESESIEAGETAVEEPLISIAGEETVDSDTENTESESAESESIEQGAISTEEPLISIAAEETVNSDTENTESESTEIESIEAGETAAEESLVSIEDQDTAGEVVEEVSASNGRKSKDVALDELDETQLVSYSLSVTVKKVAKEITDLENELFATETKIEEIKNKDEKAELEIQKVLIENDIVEKQKEQELLNYKMEVVAKVEQEIIENQDIAKVEAELAMAQSEELEFEAIALMDQAKQKRDSADVVKKKQKNNYLAEADRLDREADQKYEESAQKHLIAQEIKNAEVKIIELLAEQKVKVLELPIVTKNLTDDDKKEIAVSPAYKNYELVVTVARKKYQEADVIYLASDSLKELSSAQSKQATALREQAALSTNEGFKQELITQANALDSASVENAEESKKLVAEAEVIYQEADEKDQEAAQYLATVDQNTYENIVAYEFSVDQDSAIIAKELALAKAARDAENVKTSVAFSETIKDDFSEAESINDNVETLVNNEDMGNKMKSDEKVIEEAFVDDITELAPTIDILPTKLATDIFVQESTPTRSVYTKNKPIPQDTKLPSGIIYKVQVGAFRNEIPQDHFVGFAPIMGEKAGNGLTRYTAGVFNKFNSVNIAKNQIRNISADYGDAFVVAYLNGERISISEARRIEIEDGTTSETIALNTANTERTIDNAVVTTSETNTTKSSSMLDDASVSVNAPIRTNGGNNETGIALSIEVDRISGLFYTTQIGAYSRRVPASQLFNITPLNSDELPNGTIRYSSGVYTDLFTVGAARERIQEIGISDAFITAYYNGVRISVAEARLLVSENGSAIYADGNTNGGSNSTSSAGQTNEVFYNISLGTYGEGVPMSVAGAILRLSNQGVDETDNGDGTTTFTFGNFTDSQSAELMLEEVLDEGVASAKVIATKNGVEISLEEAKQLLGE